MLSHSLFAGLLIAGATGAIPAQLRAGGELRWGADAQGGAPFVFQDPMDPNHLMGFEVDLADAVAKKLSLRARLMPGQWEQLLPLLARGDFDVALNGIEVADEKRRVALLTRPYYAAPELLTVRRGDAQAPRTLEALKSRRVGTLPNSLAERILTRAGAQVKTYEGGQAEIYQDLKLGRTDAVLLDSPITRYYGELEQELEVLPGAFGEVQYAMAVRLTDEPLREALDQALAELTRDGSLEALYRRWGLWNEPTARLFGAAFRPEPVPAAYDAWRLAVGKPAGLAERLQDRYPRALAVLAKGALLTLALSLCSMALAMALGLALAFARCYGPRKLAWLASGYVEVVRGTPLLIQLTMIYFGLPELGLRLDPFLAGVLALGLNYAAAEAENYRAGLESVSRGQFEAAHVLGLSFPQTLRSVVLPQAVRVSLPPVTNDFIALLKDSSLVSVVTLTELTKSYGNLASSMRDHLGLGVMVAALYFLLGLPFARLARRAEAQLGRHLRKAATP